MSSTSSFETLLAVKPEIIVLGNSHVRYLLGGHGGRSFDHGSFIARGKQFGDTGATIWGLFNPMSRTGAGKNIAEYVRAEADRLPETVGLKLVLVLGEVDVRNHVLKHSSSSRTCADVIWELIYRYESWIAENIEDHCGVNLCLMGTVPYTKMFFSKDHPSRKMMKYISGLFNAALAGLCNERDWTYIDVYEQLTDVQGFLRDELSCDPTATDDIHLDHIRAAEFIVPQVERYLTNHR